VKEQKDANYESIFWGLLSSKPVSFYLLFLTVINVNRHRMRRLTQNGTTILCHGRLTARPFPASSIVSPVLDRCVPMNWIISVVASSANDENLLKNPQNIIRYRTGTTSAAVN